MEEDELDVFKVQRSLNNSKVLVYNEDRSVMYEFEPTRSFHDVIFRKREVKCYWKGFVDDDGVIQLAERCKGWDEIPHCIECGAILRLMEAEANICQECCDKDNEE
jgi:hypothetical protein